MTKREIIMQERIKKLGRLDVRCPTEDRGWLVFAEYHPGCSGEGRSLFEAIGVVYKLVNETRKL